MTTNKRGNKRAASKGAAVVPGSAETGAGLDRPAPLVAVVKEEIEAERSNGFLSLDQLRGRLPLSERSIRGAIKKRLIPAIRLPGARRLIFDWQAVQAALKRFEKGGLS